MTSWTAELEALPRLSLVTEPTPLAPASRLSAALGGPQLWFKRDDLLPVAFGGNKVRSLDLIVAEALRRGSDTLVTGAGPLSNHVRASAGVAAMTASRAEGNHWLTRMLGAEIVFTGDVDRASVDSGIEASAAKVVAQGGRPFRVPRGGACALGVLAHVLAVRETLEQCAVLGIMPRVVVMAVGGAGTLAGWLLGTALFGAVWRLEAITVSRPAVEALARARNLTELRRHGGRSGPGRRLRGLGYSRRIVHVGDLTLATVMLCAPSFLYFLRQRVPCFGCNS